MDRRKRSFRTGLLILILALLPAAGFSQTDDGDTPLPLELRIETSPANPMINSPWSVYILVNHPIPSEVNINAPAFPSFLVLERFRTEARIIQGERWTRVDFLFTPKRSGAVTLEPFEVNVRGRNALTQEIRVRFRDESPAVTRYEPRFRWLDTAPSVRSGEKSELLLELTNWDISIQAPRGFFRGRAPRNAILEESVPAAAGGGIYRYTISLIALEGSSITIEPVSFYFENYALNIPEITVSVLPASALPPKEDNPPAVTAAADNEGAQDFIRHLPFPKNRERVFPLFSGEYRQITVRVQALWDEGFRAQALAEIRRNERDSFSGPYLTSLRSEMEQALDLAFTKNERWQPLKIPLIPHGIIFLAVLFGLLILILLLSRFKRNKETTDSVTYRLNGGFRVIIILVVSIGLAFILLEENLGNFPFGSISTPSNTAVLEKTQAYRVPDFKGAVNAWFGEGQPVIVGDYHLDWCYAESPDGRAGWVRREAVITY